MPSSFVSAWDDRINPIAVKEMRQAVKGKFITWILMLFLLTHLVIIGSFLLFKENIGSDFEAGRSVFMGHLSALLVTGVFFLPIYACLRFSGERSDSNNIDLYFITSLSPAQIVWGKFSSALVLSIFFFSAGLPFMTLTYLLRGLDLPSMFILLVLDFLIVLGCIQFGILMACMPGNLATKSIRFLFGLGFLFVAYYAALSSSFALLFGGVGSSFGSWRFYGIALTVTAFILMGIGMMFNLSVYMISPPSSNRAPRIRFSLLFIWLATGIIAGVWFRVTREETIPHIWLVAMVAMFSASLLTSTGERSSISPRIARVIPQNLLLRLAAFLLYSGAAGGICFSIIMQMCTLVTGVLMLEVFLPGKVTGLLDADIYLAAVAFSLYAIDYTMSGLSFKRFFFASFQWSGLPILISCLLVALGSTIPVLIGFLMTSKPWYNLPPMWSLGNPFMVFWEPKAIPESLLFTSLWAAFVLMLNVPWMIEQIRSFKPMPATLFVGDEPEIAEVVHG